MAENVMCKNCNNYRCDWCEKVVDSPDPNMPRICQYFWGRTNADRIRAMSDEELANVVVCPHCKTNWDKCTDDCFACRLEWLKQPAKRSDNL